VVLISRFGTLETAADAVRHGAFDYISKPFDIAEVKGVVERALRSPEAPADAPACRKRRRSSAARRRCWRSTSRSRGAADAQAPVLIGRERPGKNKWRGRFTATAGAPGGRSCP
jgi:DNA-binding NtrC family response regulator